MPLTRLTAIVTRAATALALAIGASGAHAAGPAERALDSLAERTRACTACHGEQGRATREGYFPRIAGKPAGYLFNQLVNFREGRRSNPAMTYLVQHLSDAYLQEMASYFESLSLPYAGAGPAAATPEQAARAEELVLRGDPALKIPACVQCHGPALTGVAPAMPGLLGLPRDYIAGQLGAWRTGQRKALAPDCMAEISARLAPADVSALAHWLSAQPMPPDTRPAAGIALPLPIRCGSGIGAGAR